MQNEPSDPVKRADERRKALGEGDVKEKRDGTIEQREHGNIDPSLVPKGKEHPGEGPFAPEHDHVDPDLEPASRSGRQASQTMKPKLTPGTSHIEGNTVDPLTSHGA
jgi:hypothetical protein